MSGDAANKMIPARCVSQKLADAAVAGGADAELVKLEFELGWFREHCTCEAGVWAGRIRRTLEEMPDDA